jgi:hypothetical protein
MGDGGRSATGASVLAAAVLLAIALGAIGCAPTLNGYLEDLDRDEPIGAKLIPKALVTPEKDPAPAVARSLGICRFQDARAWGDRHRVGTMVGETLAAVMSLGIAVIMDGADQVHRKQPMSGLEGDLPDRIGEYLSKRGTFASCEVVDFPVESFFEQQDRGRVPRPPDLLLSGSVRAFTGQWLADPDAPHGRGPPWKLVCGRIVVDLTVLDTATREIVWQGPVVATEHDDPQFDWRLEYSSGAFENHLGVGTLGAFLRQVDTTLRTALAGIPPPTKPGEQPEKPVIPRPFGLPVRPRE